MNIMAEPWVYARDVREVAVNARDYLHVGVVETNRSGQRAYWLGIVAWSTVDRSALPVPVAPVVPGRVQLLWPDDSIDLEPQPAGRAAIGAGDPVFNGPQPDFQDAWYQLSVAQMTRLARQPPVSVSLRLDDELSVAYYGWRVEQDSLAEFLRATGFTPRRP